MFIACNDIPALAYFKLCKVDKEMLKAVDGFESMADCPVTLDEGA